MRIGVLAFALLFAACGQVDKFVPDAGPDAYQPDAPAVCAGGQMLCGVACEDVMTNEGHCGNCDTQCNGLEYCGAGTCKRFASCADYKAADPTSVNGMYQDTSAAGKTFYCNFQAGFQYDEFLMYDFTLSPGTGYTLMRAADFNNPENGPAFISWYNQVGGLHLFMGWASGNCCITTTAGQRFTANGNISFAYTGGGFACGNFTDVTLTYQLGNGTSAPFNSPLAANFFTANPIGEMAGCGDDHNPGVWMKKVSF